MHLLHQANTTILKSPQYDIKPFTPVLYKRSRSHPRDRLQNEISQVTGFTMQMLLISFFENDIIASLQATEKLIFKNQTE